MLTRQSLCQLSYTSKLMPYYMQSKNISLQRKMPGQMPGHFLLFGAGGGDRTHTMFPPTDFESALSTKFQHASIVNGQPRRLLFVHIYATHNLWAWTPFDLPTRLRSYQRSGNILNSQGSQSTPNMSTSQILAPLWHIGGYSPWS